MTQLYLIRHGEAFSNVEPIIGGMQGDKGLTALGKLQAEHLHERLAKTGEIVADVLISSDLRRAAQTAEAIAPALGLPIAWDSEIQELRVGEADGMSRDEANARFGAPDFRNEPFRPYYPGGENLGQFRLRVATALDRLLREHAGKTIVLVTHGGVVNCSFLYFWGGGPNFADAPVGFFPSNTSITHWKLRALEGRPSRWSLVSFNDTMHLRDINTGKLIGWEDVSAQPTSGNDSPAVPQVDG